MVRGIKVVPILYGISVEDLPFELRSIQGLVDENELDIYINEVKYRLGK